VATFNNLEWGNVEFGLEGHMWSSLRMGYLQIRGKKKKPPIIWSLSIVPI
jgi:hypothetical protein